MQKVKNKSYEMDMTKGPFFKKIVVFCFPLILTGVLQLLYNSADLIIVGKFSDEQDALGAVGSTAALIGLIVNLFMGLSVGSNVLVARRFASGDKEGLSRATHTTITVSFLVGIVLGIVGFFLSKVFLKLMSNPIELANVYLKIYFLGMPFNMLFNFAASILRGVGDTKRPLYFLSAAGIINVLLNLFFVIVLKMDVDGVATATVISQIISCILIMRCLVKTKEAYHFSFSKISIHKKELLEIVKIGLPAGIQSSIFSLSNVLIQSSVNKFGAAVINGNSAAQSIEGFVYISMNSVYHSALAFTGQNVGVKKYRNVKKIMLNTLAVVTIVGVVLGGTFFLLGDKLALLYTTVPEEIAITKIRLWYLCLPYFLCGIMDVTVGVLRGLGHSIMPMVVSIVGVCGFRIAWVYLVFNNFTSFQNANDLNLLYISYPISWIVTFIIHFVSYKVILSKTLKHSKDFEDLTWEY